MSPARFHISPHFILLYTIYFINTHVCNYLLQETVGYPSALCSCCKCCIVLFSRYDLEIPTEILFLKRYFKLKFTSSNPKQLKRIGQIIVNITKKTRQLFILPHVSVPVIDDLCKAHCNHHSREHRKS